MTSDVPGLGLDALMSPKSVALVGVSDRPGSFNHQVLVNLRAFDFAGDLFLVNPTRSSVDGLACVSSIAAIDQHIDHAVLLVRPEALEQVLDECEAHGVKGVTIVGHTPPATARPFRVVGPNTVGVANIADGIVPNAAGNFPLTARPGMLGIVSQSGGVSTTIVARTVSLDIGISHVIATGNEYDVTAVDAIEWMLDQPNVNGIVCYLEAIRDAGRLRSAAARALGMRKPIAVLKGGRSEVGGRAAAAHTAALATSGLVTAAAFRQWGLIPANTIDEALMATAAAMRYPTGGGTNVGLFGVGGGLGVIATDLASDAGLTLPGVAETTKEKVLELLPDASANNPFDPGGQLVGRGTENLRQALSTWTSEAPIDSVVFAVQPMNEVREHQFVDAIAEVVPDVGKPAFVAHFRGDDKMGRYTAERLREAGTLVLEPADVAFRSIRLWADWSSRASATNRVLTGEPSAAVLAARQSLQARRGNGGTVLLEHEATAMLRALDLPMLESDVALDAGSAVGIAERIGFPVAMKLLSPDVVHRAKAGALALNVADAEAVSHTFERLSGAAVYPVEGVLVQRMATQGLELIVGLHKDPVFGPVVVVGAGGVLSEAFKDVRFLFPPFDSRAALAALHELQIYSQFASWGISTSDEHRLSDILTTVAELAVHCGDTISSLDLNPVVMHGSGRGVSVFDALVYLV